MAIESSGLLSNFNSPLTSAFDTYNRFYHELAAEKKLRWRERFEMESHPNRLVITGSHDPEKLNGYTLTSSWISVLNVDGSTQEGRVHALDSGSKACLIYNQDSLAGRAFLQIIGVDHQPAILLYSFQTNYALEKQWLNPFLLWAKEQAELLQLPLYAISRLKTDDLLRDDFSQRGYQPLAELNLHLPIHPALSTRVRPMLNGMDEETENSNLAYRLHLTNGSLVEGPSIDTVFLKDFKGSFSEFFEPCHGSAVSSLEQIFSYSLLNNQSKMEIFRLY